MVTWNLIPNLHKFADIVVYTTTVHEHYIQNEHNHNTGASPTDHDITTGSGSKQMWMIDTTGFAGSSTA